MKLDWALRQREAKAEAALRPREALLRLRERLEHPIHLAGSMPTPVSRTEISALARREGFHEVVVCPCFQPFHEKELAGEAPADFDAFPNDDPSDDRVEPDPDDQLPLCCSRCEHRGSASSSLVDHCEWWPLAADRWSPAHGGMEAGEGFGACAQPTGRSGQNRSRSSGA